MSWVADQAPIRKIWLYFSKSQYKKFEVYSNVPQTTEKDLFTSEVNMTTVPPKSKLQARMTNEPTCQQT